MRAVLRAKFAPGTPLATALSRTGDAFLLEHNSAKGRDKIWSDNCDGEGTNWLGLQLLLLRDNLVREMKWTRYIRGLVDLETGQPHTDGCAGIWQQTVRRASAAVVDAVSKQAPHSVRASA